ncbi:BMP family ABC transporter substrate-binding protein [Streptomyces sp. NPDC059909]|uniref:BMP family ABC transporter substrate-binding protein n=1 Tax=Streptomyces sp. NPDC059909 TaxID=3346998 RepID=UPI00364B96A7
MKTRRTWRRNANPSAAGKGAGPGRLLAAVAGSLRGRTGWAVGSAAVVVLGLLGVWLFVGGQTPGPPDPRARQYKDFDACLLTGEKGIAAGTPAAPVWKGMQDASLETRARVNYVPVMGEQSAQNARPFLNSLIQRQCDVVLTVGAPQAEVAQAGAGEHPKVRFVVVEDESGTGAKRDGKAENVTFVKSGAGLSDSVAEAIREAVEATDA